MTKKVGTQASDFLNAIFVELRNPKKASFVVRERRQDKKQVKRDKRDE